MNNDERIEKVVKILTEYENDYSIKFKEHREDNKNGLANHYYDRYAQIKWVIELLTDDNTLNMVYNLNFNK